MKAFLIDTNDKRRVLRKKRSELGLCPECGNKLPKDTKGLCQRCKHYHRIYNKKYRRSPEARERHRIKVSEWQKRNPQRVSILVKACRQRLKEDIFNHYVPKCVCCGETHREFLTLDHINNDGNKQRQNLLGMSFYAWVRRNNYPGDLQILCWNCNQAKSFYGKCPHQREATTSV